MPWQTRLQTTRAREPRQQATDVERKFWYALKENLPQFKFRRQHPIGPYWADFACLSAHLVIELDGGQHNDSAHDEKRNAFMIALGWQVLRFWNNQVNENLEGVLIEILAVLESGPSPGSR